MLDVLEARPAAYVQRTRRRPERTAIDVSLVPRAGARRGLRQCPVPTRTAFIAGTHVCASAAGHRRLIFVAA